MKKKRQADDYDQQARQVVEAVWSQSQTLAVPAPVGKYEPPGDDEVAVQRMFACVPDEIRKLFPQESKKLEAWVAGPCIMGVVEGVNNKMALLVHEFQPTRHELATLARHYLDRVREIDFNWTHSGQSGSYEIRFHPFGHRRLATIHELLGDDEFENAISDLESEWEKKIAEIKSVEPCDECGVRHDDDFDCRAEPEEVKVN